MVEKKKKKGGKNTMKQTLKKMNRKRPINIHHTLLYNLTRIAICNSTCNLYNK